MTVKIDMEMPKNCNECRLNIFQAFEYKCTALSKKEQETVVLKNIDERPFWCPLQEGN